MVDYLGRACLIKHVGADTVALVLGKRGERRLDFPEHEQLSMLLVSRAHDETGDIEVDPVELHVRYDDSMNLTGCE